MVPLVVPGDVVYQSSTTAPLMNRRLGWDASKAYVPVVGASIQPVAAAANARLFTVTEVSPATQASAAAAHASVHSVVQQASCEPSPQTLDTQALQLADNASPLTCSLCAQRGTCTTPLRNSVGGAAGPFSVLSSIA